MTQEQFAATLERLYACELNIQRAYELLRIAKQQLRESLDAIDEA